MHLPNSRLLMPELQCVHNALTICKRSMLPEQLSPAKSSGLPSMADKQYFQKNKCDITRCQHVSGPEAYCVSMSYDQEWRQLNSSLTIVQTTCWVLLDVSLLHKMHASMCFWSRCYFWIIMVKPSSPPLCIAIRLAQQLVASLLLPKEPPKFPESTESLGKSVDSPFCLLRRALGWMQMINFQHLAFLRRNAIPCQEDGCQPMQRGDEVVRTSVLCQGQKIT